MKSLAAMEQAIRNLPFVADVRLSAMPGSGTSCAAIFVERESVDRNASDVTAAWKEVFNSSFDQESNADPMYDFTGWNSAVNLDEPIARATMEDWLAATLSRLCAYDLSRVLEVGCGTGLLLLRLCDSARLYVATDISEHVLRRLSNNISASGKGRQARVHHRPAHELADLGDGFTCVIVNSVIQYFPAPEYLHGVIRSAFGSLAEEATLFIGDVRDSRLLYAAHSEAASAWKASSAPTRAHELFRRVGMDGELSLDPSSLRLSVGDAGFSQAKCLLRRGMSNELTRYRFDLVAAKNAASAPLEIRELCWNPDTDFREAMTWVSIHRCPIVIRSVPNARVLSQLNCAASITGDASHPEAGLDPEDLCRLVESYELRAEPRTASSHNAAAFDLLVVPASFTQELWLPEDERFEALAGAIVTEPLLARFYREHVASWRRRLLEECGWAPEAITLRFAEGKHARLPPLTDVLLERTDVIEGQGVLTRAWMDLLAVDDVVDEDDWYELGGHSLIAAQFAARVRKALGIGLTIKDILDNPAFGQLRALVQSRVSQTERSTPHAATPQETLCLTHGQEALWFFQHLFPNEPTYNIPICLRWDGLLDNTALRFAARCTISRHAALRTSFHEDSFGTHWARLHNEVPFDIDEITLDSNDDCDPTTLLCERARRLFDFSAPPLLRVFVATRNEKQHYVLIVTHHIISDGWSVELLLRDLVSCYNSARQYGNYAMPWPVETDLPATLYSSTMYNPYLDAANGPREDLLNLPPPLDLAAQHKTPRHRGSLLRVAVEDATREAVTKVARYLRVTPFVVYLSAFITLVFSVTGREDFVIGIPVANRDTDDAQAAIGMFVNTVPYRANISPSMTFAQFAESTSKSWLKNMALQHIPFEVLVGRYARQRSVDRRPLVQVTFGMQEFPFAPLQPRDARIVKIDIDHGVAKFDLSLSVDNGTDGSSLFLEYDTDLFTLSDITALCRRYHTILEHTSRHPHATVATIASQLSETEISEPPLSVGSCDESAAAQPPSLFEDPLEELIAVIWQQTIRVAVAPESDFFEAGGHSLHITQIISRIRAATGIRLEVHALYHYRTIRALAAHVGDRIVAEQDDHRDASQS